MKKTISFIGKTSILSRAKLVLSLSKGIVKDEVEAVSKPVLSLSKGVRVVATSKWSGISRTLRYASPLPLLSYSGCSGDSAEVVFRPLAICHRPPAKKAMI